jgi:hypothetical protein
MVSSLYCIQLNWSGPEAVRALAIPVAVVCGERSSRGESELRPHRYRRQKSPNLTGVTAPPPCGQTLLVPGCIEVAVSLAATTDQALTLSIPARNSNHVTLLCAPQPA